MLLELYRLVFNIPPETSINVELPGISQKELHLVCRMNWYIVVVVLVLVVNHIPVDKRSVGLR